MPKVKNPSRRNVQRYDNNLSVSKETKKRYNEDFKSKWIAPLRYVDWYDFGRINILNYFEKSSWKDVLNAMIYNNSIRTFYANLSVKKNKDDIYLSTFVYSVKIELNSNVLAQILEIPRGDFTRTYDSHQFLKAPHTLTSLYQMRLLFGRILDDSEKTIAMPYLVKCIYCIQ